MSGLFQGMEEALAVARLAAAQGEVPIGALLQLDGQTLAVAANTCLAADHPLQHAEMKVLQQMADQLDQEDFRRATLFVTLEPCPMCLGAMLHLHLGRLVFAAYNLKWGACGTVADLTQFFPAERLEIYGGICEAEASDLLATFFARLRHEGGSQKS